MAEFKKNLVVIAGPTAIGKTSLAIQLAKLWDTVIINADSRQFYKELTIGTAKPSNSELEIIKHYFINNKSVNELYGAGHFANDAEALIQNLFKEKDILFLVGGSGLYIDALLNGVDEFVEVPIQVREQLNILYKEKGIEAILNLLKEKDADYYLKVDKKNSQRIIRALEVCLHTKKPYSSFLKENKIEKNYNVIKILLNEDRQLLYDKINKRVDKMIDDGLLAEVQGLLEYENNNALKTVGYKELFEFLNNKCTLNEAIDKIKQHTRNYAKRQLTWFNNKGNYKNFNPNNYKEITEYIDKKINNV